MSIIRSLAQHENAMKYDTDSNSFDYARTRSSVQESHTAPNQLYQLGYFMLTVTLKMALFAVFALNWYYFQAQCGKCSKFSSLKYS